MDPALRDELLGLAAALGIGLLIGLEREHRHGAENKQPVAGVRTFALTALTGAIAWRLGPVAFALAGAFVAAGAIASYLRLAAEDPGLTSEVALVCTLLLGALAMSAPALAGGLGVAVAVLLASKSKLHDFARSTLSEQEMRDGLLLAAAALIVLPLLPDGAPDPWGAFNLRRLWMLVVLVMAINAAGYVALRTLGPRMGLAITGFTSGFVSSTATIGSMGSRARSDPKLLPHCVAAALMSNVATIVQLAIVIGALSVGLLRQLAIPLAVTGAAAIVAAVLASWRSFGGVAKSGDVVPGRAFQPSHALAFAAIVGVALLLSAWINAAYGERGLLLAVGATGLADVHAAAASVAQVTGAGPPDSGSGALAVLVAFSANSVSKLVVAAVSGGFSFCVRVLPGIVAMNAAFAATVLGWLTTP